MINWFSVMNIYRNFFSSEFWCDFLSSRLPLFNKTSQFTSQMNLPPFSVPIFLYFNSVMSRVRRTRIERKKNTWKIITSRTSSSLLLWSYHNDSIDHHNMNILIWSLKLNEFYWNLLITYKAHRSDRYASSSPILFPKMDIVYSVPTSAVPVPMYFMSVPTSSHLIYISMEGAWWSTRNSCSSNCHRNIQKSNK